MGRPADKLTLIMDGRWTNEEIGAWHDHIRGVLTKLATDNGLPSWPSSDRPLSTRDTEAVQKLLPVVEFMYTQEVSFSQRYKKSHEVVLSELKEIQKAVEKALLAQTAQERLSRFSEDAEIAVECHSAHERLGDGNKLVVETVTRSSKAHQEEERGAWMAARSQVRSKVVEVALEELRALVADKESKEG